MKRIYAGYYVVFALFLAEIAVTGISFYSFSLFIRAWQHDTSLNWSLTAINASLSVSVVAAVASPWLGRLVDRWGPKRMMLVGISLIGLSFAASSAMTEIWHLWALQALLMVGQTAGFLGTGKLIGLWFVRHRGRMMGIAIAGNNAGGMIMAPLTAFLLGQIGWRLTFLTYGIGILAINVPVIYFLVSDAPSGRAGRRLQEDANVHAGESIDSRAKNDEPSIYEAPASGVKSAIMGLAFWLIIAASFANGASVYAVLSQLGKHLDLVGISASTTGLALGLLGAFGLVGKLIYGFAAEKVPARHVFAASLATQIVGIVFLLLVRSPSGGWLFYSFVVVYGLGSSGAGALLPLVVVEKYGLAHYGAISGAMGMGQRILSTPVPVLIGLSVDSSGSYILAFYTTLAVLVIGAVCSSAVGSAGVRVRSAAAESRTSSQRP